MADIAEHERQQEVLRLLDGAGRVSVQDLATRFGVSLVTVRKDLEALERRRLLRRVRGGAVGASGADEGAFEMRLRYRSAEKMAIARAAAEIVHDGDAIALDCSTTCYFLAQELRDRRGLVVLTNGLRTAELLSEAGATVVLPGGTLRRSSWSLVGDIGDVFVGRGRVARGFFGVRSLSPEAGLLELSPEETAAKRRLVSVCGEVYGLFDSSKVGRFALHTFAEPHQITGLITDTGTDAKDIAGWRAAGVEVRTAGPER
jgi:DeoR family transcriptional regulator, aga operon transcriptional repressor